MLVIFLVSCYPRVEEKDRIKTIFNFSKAMVMNYKESQKNFYFSGRKKGGSGMVDIDGIIEVKKDKIILSFLDQNKNGDLESETDTAIVKNCFLIEDDNGYKNFEYKTNKGDFTVLINEKKEVYSISHNDWVNNITFLK